MSGLLLLAASGRPPSIYAQLATSDRISQPGFWPTQTIWPRDSYAGPQACADCHKEIFDDAERTSMARTAMPARASHILRTHPDLTFTHSGYHYEIRTADGTSIYTTMKGPRQESAGLAWAFGTDDVAQSWLFKKKDGQFYEVRVTYFRKLDGLNFTPGRALNDPANISDAMDRQIGRAELYRCFACHTTASGMGSSFDDTKLIAGVSCEACHGPGRAHVDAMEDLPPEVTGRHPHENTADAIFNPEKLTPEESVDFCGSCHGSYWDVSLSGSTGVGNARFQPYRLEESKCWNKNDSRLTCIACHDPHKPLDPVAEHYDHVCLSCHLNNAAEPEKIAARVESSHPGRACPVARRNCTTCHMPEVYVPDMHQSFPDHRIRIVRAGEPFPD